jgi:hypothetical protein
MTEFTIELELLRVLAVVEGDRLWNRRGAQSDCYDDQQGNQDETDRQQGPPRSSDPATV